MSLLVHIKMHVSHFIRIVHQLSITLVEVSLALDYVKLKMCLEKLENIFSRKCILFFVVVVDYFFSEMLFLAFLYLSIFDV